MVVCLYQSAAFISPISGISAGLQNADSSTRKRVSKFTILRSKGNRSTTKSNQVFLVFAAGEQHAFTNPYFSSPLNNPRSNAKKDIETYRYIDPTNDHRKVFRRTINKTVSNVAASRCFDTHCK